MSVSKAMTVRLYYKSAWYQMPPMFVDISDCPSVQAAEEMFRRVNPELELLTHRSQVVGRASTTEFNEFGQSKVVNADGTLKTVYHGTVAEFSEFRPNYRNGEQLGFGIHFSESLNLASEYAHGASARKKRGSPRIILAHLVIRNPLDAHAIVKEGSKEFVLAKQLARHRLFTQKDMLGVLMVYMQNAIDISSPKRAARLIQEAGYDGVRYESNVIELNGRGYTKIATAISWIVFESDQIRTLKCNREGLTV